MLSWFPQTDEWDYCITHEKLLLPKKSIVTGTRQWDPKSEAVSENKRKWPRKVNVWRKGMRIIEQNLTLQMYARFALSCSREGWAMFFRNKWQICDELKLKNCGTSTAKHFQGTITMAPSSSAAVKHKRMERWWFPQTLGCFANDGGKGKRHRRDRRGGQTTERPAQTKQALRSQKGQENIR